MFSAVIGALFPVFGLIAVGYGCGRKALFGEGADGALSRFVAQLTLPVLTFHTLAEMDPSNLAIPTMALAVVGGAYATYAVSFVVEHRLGMAAGEANIAALSASYSNSAFVGLPVCYVLLGKDSLAPATVVIALQTLFIFSAAVLVSVLVGGGKRTLREALRMIARQLATNPLVVGAIGGVALAVTGLRLPPPVDLTLRTLGAATGPCALIAIGMFMARPLEHFNRAAVLRALGCKLLIHPALTMGVLVAVPALPGVWRDTALLMAAMPTASSTFVLAVKAGSRSMHLAAAVIVFATVAAAVVLPILLTSAGQLGLIGLASGQ